MMAPGHLFPNSMSTDMVDRLNHKWALLLMLLLAIVSFLVPLHPAYNYNYDCGDDVKIPKFAAFCWTPSTFTGAHVAYSMAYCAKMYNAAIRGEDVGGVHKVRDDTRPFNSEQSLKIQKHEKEMERRRTRLNEVKQRICSLVSFDVPITLILVSIGLGLSNVVWVVITEWFGSFNLLRTLESASSLTSITSGSDEKQFYEDIAESVTVTTHGSPRTLSVLYLVKKILSVLFVLGSFLVILQYSLPNVEQLQKDIDKHSTPSASEMQPNEEATNSNMRTNPPELTSSNPTNDIVFFCDVTVRQLSNTHRYSLQCIAVQENDNGNESPSLTSPSHSTGSVVVRKDLLQIELLMLRIALALLVVLFVNNVFSLCDWACKLLSSSSRLSLGLPDNAPTDVVSRGGSIRKAEG